MASRLKKGIYGMTHPRVTEGVLGTAIVHSRQFDNIEGEIINERNDYYKYLTVQVPSEYNGRVYILNLQHDQCSNMKWGRRRK